MNGCVRVDFTGLICGQRDDRMIVGPRDRRGGYHEQSGMGAVRTRAKIAGSDGRK